MEDVVVFYHHGILGMRWGIRRTPEQLMRARGKLEKKYHKTEKKVVKKEFKSQKYRVKSIKKKRWAYWFDAEDYYGGKILKYELKSAKFERAAAKGKQKLANLQKKMDILDTKLKGFTDKELEEARVKVFGVKDDPKKQTENDR